MINNRMKQFFFIGLFTVFSFALCFLLGSYYLLVFTLCLLTALVGIGLNVLMGMSGQISFGHIAFYAIGAYISALLLMNGVPFPLSLLLAAVFSGVIGALLAIPALRVSGPYLAMITIAFAFVIHHSLIEWRSLTGGANGLMGIPMPELANTDANLLLALTASFLVSIALVAYACFYNSGWGKAMRAVKASPIAARSLGFNPIQTKTLAFAISSAITGLAGAIVPPLMMFISPSTFPFSQSILFVLVVILGGTGTLWGPVLGALIVVVLPEMLSPLAEYRLLIFAALLLIVLWGAPRGILGELQKRFVKLPVELPPKQTNKDLINAFYNRSDNQITGLEVNGIGIQFGGVKAAQNVSFHAKLGKVTSIIGPNGAGKTTVLNMISGFYQPDQGSINLGEQLAGQGAYKIARCGISRTYQTSQLFDDMSVIENLLSAMQKGQLGQLFQSEQKGQKELALNLLSFVGYQGSIHTPTQDLPHVDRRLVEIARSLASQPRVLLLDEPAAGLSREDTDKLAKLLSAIAEFGIAVILVEHDMPLVMSVSDHILVLDAGQPIASGAPEEIKHNQRVIAAYLGGTEYQAQPRKTPWQGAKDAVLFCKKLSVDYGAAPVVKEVDLVIYPGELVAILGANGAGKSSILQALAGLKRPISGQIGLHDQYIHQLPANAIAHLGLALVPEGRQLFGQLSVKDNLIMGAHSRIDTVDYEQEIADILERFPRLKDRIHSEAGLLSGGEQQMVAVGRALMAKPSILLLDEPSLGLAPAMIGELYDALATLRDDGVTILLVDQMANLALQIADRAYVLETGNIVKAATSRELLEDANLAQAYMGGA
ncbi:branched-chain amino acid ABC transporter ATP-binding protein/permease [Marinomonas dokdonensis]|uniref:branched-chain amino acid ABC transporter ATP-binding protein/permease n=1 Tax=Marinomonas dokdonensis TaxID=328224 RepID=UPI00405576C1